MGGEEEGMVIDEEGIVGIVDGLNLLDCVLELRYSQGLIYHTPHIRTGMGSNG